MFDHGLAWIEFGAIVAVIFLFKAHRKSGWSNSINRLTSWRIFYSSPKKRIGSKFQLLSLSGSLAGRMLWIAKRYFPPLPSLFFIVLSWFDRLPFFIGLPYLVLPCFIIPTCLFNRMGGLRIRD
jgi:hypothetical protein